MSDPAPKSGQQPEENQEPAGKGVDPVAPTDPVTPADTVVPADPVAPTDPVIPTDHLSPTGVAVDLTPEMKLVAGPSEVQLDLDAINNRGFNPLKAQIGAFSEPGEMYQGKALLPIRDLIGAVAQQGGADMAALTALLGALPEVCVYRSAAHQYPVDGGSRIGNLVVFYGGQRGHSHINALTSEVGKQHMRLVKQMVHFNEAAQGGTPGDIVSDCVAGATHAGGFSAGWREGHPKSIKSDWPWDYGYLDDQHVHYNAHLLAIDYQAGTEQEVPDVTLAAWKSNADMIDAFAGMVVPFAGGDLDQRYTNYQFNPLEVNSDASAAEVMKDLANLDRTKLLQKHGAFYCAEGQYSVASMGWKASCLLKKSAFGDTPLGTLIDEFGNAAGLTRNADGQITNPDVGWEHLKDRGLITSQQLKELVKKFRNSVGLQWIAEDIHGSDAYGCKNAEGMIAEPMSVATMVWALLRTYLPREGMAHAMATDILKAYGDGDSSVQVGLKLLLGGQDPTDENGQRALAELCMKAAGGLLLQVVGADEFRNRLLHQAGYDEITNDADKAKVTALYAEFLGVLQSPDIADQESLDEAVAAVDRKFKELEVERNDFDPFTGETTGQRMRTMQYAAPACMGYWAQQPELFGSSGALRYLATAQHSEQASAAANSST